MTRPAPEGLNALIPAEPSSPHRPNATHGLGGASFQSSVLVRPAGYVRAAPDSIHPSVCNTDCQDSPGCTLRYARAVPGSGTEWNHPPKLPSPHPASRDMTAVTGSWSPIVCTRLSTAASSAVLTDSVGFGGIAPSCAWARLNDAAGCPPDAGFARKASAR